MCLAPVTLKRNYRTISGDFTDIVPCGKCHLCLARRRNDWSFRLMKEAGQSKTACFMTLTYEEAPLSFNGHMSLHRPDLTNFFKKLRHYCPKIPYIKKDGTTGYKSDIKYYAVGEYGTNFLRPHYHVIIFNTPLPLLQKPAKIQKQIWQHGHVDIAPCNIRTVSYVANYLMSGNFEPERDDDDRVYPFATMSKNLGLNYLTPAIVKYHVENMVNVITRPGGQIQQLPRYYKKKIFSKTERTQLAEEAKAVNNLNWEEFLNHDFKHEIDHKRDQVRKFKKEQRLKAKKL